MSVESRMDHDLETALHRGLRRSPFLLLPDGGHALAVTESAAMAAAIDSLLAGS
jgi:pimeloyl-ACP methyl ester carboxylesterase